jgi:phospho-N-acetylmuramoyl-pentapeptide-transferase
MLYHLLYPFADHFTALNLFRYLTFRTGGALLTSLIMSFAIAPTLIAWLKSKQRGGQPIRTDGPQSHIETKQGTPTMGGVLILLASLSSTLLWMDWLNPAVWSVLLVTVGYGLVGFGDDWLKVTKRNHKGLSARLKMVGLIVFGCIGIALSMVYSMPEQRYGLAIPFIKDFFLHLGWFFPVFALIVVVGCSNAVNLTDGLDGLAIVPVIITTFCFAIIAWLVGNKVFAGYLQIPYVPGTGEIAVFCGALIGAALGFLWYNAPPAQVFMGDTGALALGGALGMISVITKHELVLGIIGGVFVLEALSVMIQVASFKLTGKRVFKMAPIHHHFEKQGWKEATVVIRFWIVAFIFALIGLATLKIR